MKVKMTVKQFADAMGVDPVSASGCMRVLVQKKIVEQVGTVASPGGKGKPANLYEIPAHVSFAVPVPEPVGT